MLKDNARKWQLTKNRFFFSTFGRPENPRSKCQLVSCLVWAPSASPVSPELQQSKGGHSSTTWGQWCWQLRLVKRTPHVLLWRNMRNCLVKTGQKTACGKIAKIHRKKRILCGNGKESLCYHKHSSHCVCWAFTSSPSSSTYMRLASSHTTMGWVGRDISGDIRADSLCAFVMMMMMCVCAHVWVCFCLCLWMWDASGGCWIALSISPHLPACSRQCLLFSVEYRKLAGLFISRLLGCSCGCYHI